MSSGQIVGRYVKPDGSPQEGAVVIIPSVPLVRDAAGHTVISGRANVALVNGAFTVTVPASDDAELDPAGVTYTVAPRFNASHPPAVVGVFVPAGATVQMSDVTPVYPAAPVYALPVTQAQVAAVQAAANAHTDAAIAALTIPPDTSAAVAALQASVTNLQKYTIALDTDGAPYLVIGA
jgi:hypothetical protein